MLQAYRAGLLLPDYKFKWTSRIREKWMLDLLESEYTADASLEMLRLQAAFSSRIEDPKQAIAEIGKKMFQRMLQREGDVTACLGVGADPASQQKMQQLWKIMKEQGMLDSNKL